MSKLMGMIRIAKAQLGMDEDTYRDFLKNTLGKRSLAGSTGKEQWKVVEALKEKGLSPGLSIRARSCPVTRKPKKFGHFGSQWPTVALCVTGRNRRSTGMYAASPGKRWQMQQQSSVLS